MNRRMYGVLQVHTSVSMVNFARLVEKPVCDGEKQLSARIKGELVVIH